MPRNRTETKLAADPAQTIEAEIAGMQTSKAQLEARLPALHAAKTEALARRRESLIAGSGADAEAKHARAAREADDNLNAVTDALAALESRLAEANERLAATRDRVARDAAAAELERDCEAVDAAAKTAREALGAFRQAADALTEAVTPLIAGQSGFGYRVPPERVGTILVANMLAADLPAFKVSTHSEIIEGHWHYGQEIEPKPEHAADPVGAVLTERLRSLAADIRAGTASPVLSRWNEPEPQFTAQLDTKPAYVIRPFTYRDGKEQPEVFVGTVHRELPAPLADFAIRAGVVIEVKPANWADISKPTDVGGLVTVYEHSAVRLAFDLSEYKAADVKRQRAAWLAEQAREAA